MREVGRALAGERVHAFLLVFQREGGVEQATLHVDTLLHIERLDMNQPSEIILAVTSAKVPAK